MFVPSDRNVLVLNEQQAKTLGISTADIESGNAPQVKFEEEQFRVIGIISMDIDRVKTLDGKKVTPVKFNAQPNVWEVHVFIEECMILPYDTVIAMGGDVARIKMTFRDPKVIPKVAEELIDMLPSYDIYSNYNGKIFRYSREGLITTWGFQHQTVPMAIVMLTVVNIMLGSVYERRKQIFTYGSVGLSPLHISLMFLAETTSYAVVGGIVGYLFAMVLGRMAGFVTQGAISANYSSIYVLMALEVSMGVTILSSLYPILVASRMVTPSLERKWKIPIKPKTNFRDIPLPFYASSERETFGVMRYISEYLEAHRISGAPDFLVLDIRFSEGKNERQQRCKNVIADLRLSPYEAGVVQTSAISMTEVEPSRWQCFLALERKMGTQEEWVRLNYNYVDNLRKQLLLWRSLKDVERERYMKKSINNEV